MIATDSEPAAVARCRLRDAIDAVATLGDVNGDGIADYAIGVSTANAGTGSVYVVFGDKY